MKNLWKMIGASGFLYLLFVMPAMAQLGHPVTFTTPFAFYAGNTKMPAGTYTISPSSLTPDIVEIEDSKGTHSGFMDVNQTQSEQPRPTSEVTFTRYGTTEFVNTIWAAGQVLGMQVEQSKAEKAFAAKAPGQKHSVPGK